MNDRVTGVSRTVTMPPQGVADTSATCACAASCRATSRWPRGFQYEWSSSGASAATVARRLLTGERRGGVVYTGARSRCCGEQRRHTADSHTDSRSGAPSGAVEGRSQRCSSKHSTRMAHRSRRASQRASAREWQNRESILKKKNHATRDKGVAERRWQRRRACPRRRLSCLGPV